MSSSDLHQILIPYLFASGAMGLIVGVAAALLKRDGDREKATKDRRQDPGL